VANNTILVTAHEKDFGHLPGLIIEIW
jgi:hypothetical protein